MLLVCQALLFWGTPLSARNIDYTGYVGGAMCDNASYWTISNGHNGVMQCDTWSARGGKDGSDMTTPFMEYWISGSEGPLADAHIRHQQVGGLPAGQYMLQMRIRCYDETGSGTPSGTLNLWANGMSVSAIDDADTGEYNGQHYTVNTVGITCTVGDDGLLDFGLDVSGMSYCNWIAWKDVELYYNDGTTTPKVIDSGTYYLRHKTSGLYLNGGGIYGTHAVLGKHALPIHLTKTSDDRFYIDCGFTGYLGFSDGDLFCDVWAQEWIIAPAGDNYYNIGGPGFIGSYGEADGDYVSTLDADPSQDCMQWELLTHEEMLNTMLTATPEKPVDATFLISNPRFDRNYAENYWEGSSFTIGGLNENMCAEVWNTNFDVYQILDNIPNGRYRLSVQGFYRWNNVWGNNTNWYAVVGHNNGTEQLYAELYANDDFTPLQSIASELEQMQLLGLPGGDSNLPYSMTEASYAFSAGLYDANAVEVDVKDHELTIGLRKLLQDGCDWTIWDNFELTLLQAGNNADYDPSGGQGEEIPFSEATWDHPVDATSLIANPGFDNSRGWQGSPSIGGDSSNRNAEKYNTSFDVYQYIENLPDGWYKLTAQGFYRYGSYEWEQHKSYYGGGWEENDANNVYAMYTIPYATISRQLGVEKGLARIYANDFEQELPSPFDYVHDVPTHSGDYYTDLGWVVDSQQGASEAFAAGEFPVELLVPVTEGSICLGVYKYLGYKYDWTCWDNFHLYYLGTDRFEYATGINVSETSITMTRGEKRQLTATVEPATASNKKLFWTSSDYNVVHVDQNGTITAYGDGQATITVIALGSQGQLVVKDINIQVSTTTANPSRIVINEIQVSNLDMFLDRSLNYGGYVEIYNPTTRGFSLDGLWVSDDANNLQKYRLNQNSGAVPAKGFGLIWFDHGTWESGQVDFKLNMDGGTIYISNDNGKLLASQTYPAAVSRTSYARTTDGGDTWGITAYPTPGSSNSGSREMLSATDYERLPMPEVSHDSQLFTTPFQLTVTVPAGATLRYTADGTTPTLTNGLTYTNALTISKTTVLRMRLFQNGMLPSAVRTCSYILRDKDYMLPVLSVVSDPGGLYSDSLGVFVTGVNGVSGSGISFSCNWNMDWDRPAAFNYITADGDSVHSQEVTLTRFGGWSRSWYPYNFKLKAQGQYEGQKYLTFPFFPNKPYQRNKVLQVRNGGNDLLCRIKDAALHNIIISSGLHLDCQDYMPVHTFINGSYIGMLNMREPSNKHMGYSNYGLDTDEMDQMRLGGGVEVNVGTDEAFWRWSNLARQADKEDVYREICDLVDIDEFVNYMATQMFLGGDDWPGNNCKAFKGWDGKFHIVLFDIDQALRFDAYAFTHIQNNRSVPLVNIFLNMLKNPTFRRLFIDTYCVVAGSVFDPDRCASIIDRISSEMDPALALENLSTQPTAGFMKQVLTASRRDRMMEGLRNWRQAQINSPAQRVQLSSNVAGAQLLVNDVMVPTGRFDGTLFAPCTLTATAPEGYTFKGWQDETGTIIATKPTFSIDGKGGLTLTAVYEQVTSDEELLQQIAMPIKVNEVSAGNDIYANEYFKRNDWLELYNNTDQPLDVAGLYLSDDADNPLKYQIPTGTPLNTIIPARGHLILWADKLDALSQLHTNFKLGNSKGQLVIVSSSDAFVAANSTYFDQHPKMRSFVDALTYDAHPGDQSVGRFPDGGQLFYQMTRPTIERTNHLLTADSLVGEDQNMMRPDDGRFELYLEKGWNWTSHILYDPIPVDDLSSYAQRIVGQHYEATRDARLGMTGTLRQLEARQLYKVQMNQADTYSSDAMHCNPLQPISLQQGWNWIGYPCNGEQTLTLALSGTLLEEGDQLIGQDGFATFTAGRWHGTLTAFETGKGYLFRSSSVKNLQMHAPEVPVNMSRARSSISSQYGVDKHAYPDVMGIIAQLQKDGQVLEADRFTLLAYVADDCRGYSKDADDLCWLTVYGNNGEAVEYRAVDHTDGAVYAVEQQATFATTISGTLTEPVVLTLTEKLYDDPSAIDGITPIATATSPVEGYYSLSGVLVARYAASLKQGIYVVKYADGTFRKISIR